MKKMIAFTTIMVLTATSMAFATTVFESYDTTKFKASTKVKVAASSGTTSFAAAAKHLNGTRTYGIASNSSQVSYIETVLPGNPVTDAQVTASDSSAFAAGTWTSL